MNPPFVRRRLCIVYFRSPSSVVIPFLATLCQCCALYIIPRQSCSRTEIKTLSMTTTSGSTSSLSVGSCSWDFRELARVAKAHARTSKKRGACRSDSMSNQTLPRWHTEDYAPSTSLEPSNHLGGSHQRLSLSPTRWRDFEDPHSSSPPASVTGYQQNSREQSIYVDSRKDTPSSSKHSSLSRKECRQSEAMAYKAVRDAHAKGLSAKYLITTSPDGEILTGKLKWMAAVRAVAMRTVDFSIREFKKNQHQWEWTLSKIEKELDEQFSYTNLLRKNLLGDYLGDALSNDRHRWKKHWIETEGGQHESCPDEAFVKLDKFRRSNEARVQSDRMKTMRSLVGKRSRSSSVPSSDHLSEQGTPDFAQYKHVRSSEEDSWKMHMEHRVDEMYTEFKNTASSIAELLALVKQNTSGYHITTDPETIRSSSASPDFVQVPIVVPPPSQCPSTLTTTTPPTSLKDSQIQPERLNPRTSTPTFLKGLQIQPETLPPRTSTQEDQSNSDSLQHSPINTQKPPTPALEQLMTQGHDLSDQADESVQDLSNDQQDQTGPNLWKKRENVNATFMTPPSMITPRLTNAPVPANKFVWILHPRHENIVVAQGKLGVVWKSKSKLAADCAIGEQLVQVHRIFVKNVELMCAVRGDEFKTLDDALPPSIGRHKSVKWDTKHLVVFSPNGV